MKKILTLAALAALTLAPATSRAHEYDRDDSDHPLRLVAYVLHPIGVAAEYFVLRPIHNLVSLNDCTNDWFGHETTAAEKARRNCCVVKAEVPVTDDHGVVTSTTMLTDVAVIYFDFDKHNIRPDQLPNADKNLEYLKSHPNAKVIIEGHCDERGTTEYNYSLGEKRAKAVQEYFAANGISADRLTSVSKGEEAPADPGHEEGAWAKNRRAEIKEAK